MEIEFAGKFRYRVVSTLYIDNLVKEMTEDQKNDPKEIH